MTAHDDNAPMHDILAELADALAASQQHLDQSMRAFVVSQLAPDDDLEVAVATWQYPLLAAQLAVQTAVQHHTCPDAFTTCATTIQRLVKSVREQIADTEQDVALLQSLQQLDKATTASAADKSSEQQQQQQSSSACLTLTEARALLQQNTAAVRRCHSVAQRVSALKQESDDAVSYQLEHRCLANPTPTLDM
ncbi:hypothetical protein RI367_006544 [Sorochytrium milnesiophthora]